MQLVFVSPLRAIGLSFVALLPALAAGAQRTEQDPTRWVRLLELPERRPEALVNLWRIGKPAGPALLRALDDPRPSVRTTALGALSFVPVDAAGLARLDVLAARDASSECSAAARAAVSQRLAGRTAVLLWEAHCIEWLGAAADDKPKLIRNLGKATYDGELLPDGGLLVTQGSVLLEWDAAGKERWTYGAVSSAIDVDRLGAGHTLIADRGLGKAFEVDPTDKVVWEYQLAAGAGKLVAVEVERMPSGNTLVCHHVKAKDGGGALEVDPNGKLVRTFSCDAASDADVAPDGRIVVLSRQPKKVLVFSPAGKQLASFDIDGDASEVDVLPDGTFLLAMQRSVDRYRIDGTKLGSVPCPGNPCSVQVMVGGRIPAAEAAPGPRARGTRR